jgi:signal peptidase II
MRRHLGISGILAALDQAVKLIILERYKGVPSVLVPGVLRFDPVQNQNLSWIAILADIKMPAFVMIVIQVLLASLLVVFFSYQRFVRPGKNLMLSLGFCAAFSGILCSFIDVVFWGGSLDYIGFLNWFVFDMKDVFLNIGSIAIVIWLNSNAGRENENENEKGKEKAGVSFAVWLKNRLKFLKNRP